MWRAANGDNDQRGTGLNTIKLPTGCLHALDVHETHCTIWFQTLRYRNLLGGPSILGQVNQSLAVEIHANFAEVHLERDGGYQETGEIKHIRHRSRLS